MPAELGVPLSTPVLALKVMPAGGLAPLTDHKMVGEPVALKVVL